MNSSSNQAAGELPDPSPAQVPPAAEAAGGDAEILAQAFLKGAGLPNITLSGGMTPELMETIGKLLSIAVQGTVELSEMRSLVKREVNAEMTMVVVRNNNPLKFFTDGPTVLTQMLRKKMPGFMGPVEAMEDAYQDLKAHQSAVVVGVRAAMRELLRKLKPSTFEEEVPSMPGVDQLLPAFRKSRLWNEYRERFRELKRDARDDFQALFGQAFLDAYEKEVERVKSGVKSE
jgi:FHA domain-containing protein